MPYPDEQKKGLISGAQQRRQMMAPAKPALGPKVGRAPKAAMQPRRAGAAPEAATTPYAPKPGSRGMAGEPTKAATPPIQAPPQEKLAGIRDVLASKSVGMGGVQPAALPPESRERQHGFGAGPVAPPRPGSRPL